MTTIVKFNLFINQLMNIDNFNYRNYPYEGVLTLLEKNEKDLHDIIVMFNSNSVNELLASKFFSKSYLIHLFDMLEGLESACSYYSENTDFLVDHISTIDGEEETDELLDFVSAFSKIDIDFEEIENLFKKFNNY